MPRACSSGRRSVSLPVSARTRDVLPWSTCPAVPTVSAIGPGLGPSTQLARAAVTARATSSTSSVRSVRASSSSRPSRTIPITGGSPSRSGVGELLLDRAGDARQLRERERAAADPRDGLLELAADERGEALRARAHRVDRLVEHAQDGDLAAGALAGRRGARASPRARRGSACRRGAPAGAGGGGAARRGRLPDDDARPAARRAACRRRSRRGRRLPRGSRTRSARRRARAASPSRGRRRAAGSPVRDPREVARRDRRGEPDDAVVRLVDARSARSPGRSRARSPPRASCWSSRPRPSARPERRARRGCGSRRRSRPARRARR